MHTVDFKVQSLISEVQKRKSEIGKIEGQTFKTNCQYQCIMNSKDNSTILNIQVISKVTQLIHILSDLNMRKKSWEAICFLDGLNYKFEWQGYSYDDWANDIKNIISKLSLASKINDLKTLEDRLDKLVSPELRAQIEIGLIEKELGL